MKRKRTPRREEENIPDTNCRTRPGKTEGPLSAPVNDTHMTEGVASEEDSKTTEQQELLKNGSVRDIVFYHVKHMLGYRWPEAEARIFSVEGFETRELTMSDAFPVIGERHYSHKNFMDTDWRCPDVHCNERMKARTNYAEIYLRSAASEIRHDFTEWILDENQAADLEDYIKWKTHETGSKPHYSLEDLKEISLPYYLLGGKYQCCDSEPREPHDQSPRTIRGAFYVEHRRGREDSLERIPLFEERMTNPENERVHETFWTYLEVTTLNWRMIAKEPTFERKVWEAFLKSTDPIADAGRRIRSYCDSPWTLAKRQLGEEAETFRKKNLLKSKNPEHIFYYTGSVDAPWPEAEGILKGTDFWDAYNYYFYYGPDYDFWNKPWFGFEEGYYGEPNKYHIIPNPRDFYTVGKKWASILPRWSEAKKPEPKTAKTYSGPRAQKRGKRGRRQHR
jgi:hypothetical protein